MPIGEFPILEVIVRQLAAAGFGHITMAVNHQAEIIKAFFGDGARWNCRIDYSLENVPLGTMGPLKLIHDLPDHVLVMNGDILTDLDFSAFHDAHVASKAAFTISATHRRSSIDYGVLESNEQGFLTGFKEKPFVDYEVSMGIYMISRKALSYIPAGTLYGFDRLMLDLLRVGDPVAVRKYDGYWLDIGRPDDYMRAIDEFDSLKTRFLRD
jgi:NDP-sugar pyrophosphorylase family protein